MTQFNQELITKARKGEIAIKHDGTVEELREILEAVFPNDWTTSNICAATARYFVAKPYDKTLWIAESDTDLPAHSVKDFFMTDTKDTPQPRTYKITRQQMKEIWEGVPISAKQAIRQDAENIFSVFENESEITAGDIVSMLGCFNEPYPEVFKKVFPAYFFIPEGEPVLVRQEDGQDWNILVSNGTGGAYTKGRLYGFSDTFKQIIPFTKNPPK